MAKQNTDPKTLLCCGEILCDFLAVPPGTGLGEASVFEKRPGGSPFNTAVGLARLGCKTGFLTKLGMDAFGRELKELIVRDGLDPRYLIDGASCNTTLAMIATDSQGQPQFQFYRDRAADVSLLWEELPTIDSSRTALCHFGSISLADPPAADTYFRLFCTLRSEGVLTALDPNIRPLYLEGKKGFKPRLLEMIRDTSILKLSDEDLHWITGEKHIERGLQALPHNPERLTVATLGAQGALALWSGGQLFVPAFPVNVVDTTGCGDAFMAGLLHGLAPFAEDLSALDKTALHAILVRSAACAAIVAGRLGAASAMPVPEELDAFLHSHLGRRP